MFADKLIQQIKAKHTPLVVGLDPNIQLIPASFKANFKIHPDDYFEGNARIYFEYNRLIIDSIHDLVPALKPQMAYYETLGHFGLKALKDTVEYAYSKNLLVILDAKRNDIPATAEAYVSAYLTNKQHKPYLETDCITVTPFLGMDSLEPFYVACREAGKGVFICLKTSNHGSGDLQDQLSQRGLPMYLELADLINTHAATNIGENGYSSIGVVVGATYPEQAKELRAKMPHSYFLVPGIGHQGGDMNQIRNFFNKDRLGAVLNVSRSIMYPEKLKAATHIADTAMANEIRHQAIQLIGLVNQHL